ncbi:Uncharacterised protein [Brucella neotomae]|nr:Uncharacterised protein [Brucella neotomae]
MELDFDRALADQSAQLVIRRHGAFEIGFHRCFIDLDSKLDKLFTIFFSLVRHIGRNFTNRCRSADGAIPGQGLHFDQIDDTDEIVFSADRQLNRKCHSTKARTNHLHRAVEVGTDLVHLVDEDHARDVVLFSLTPHGFGLGLNASIGVEQRNRAVEHTQRTLNFNREVNVARRVDDVEAALLTITALPERGRSSRGDRDTAFLLLLHPVHGRRTIVGFADLVVLTGIEQNALGHRRLAGVDVSHDTEIAVVFDFIFAGHDSRSLNRFRRLPAVMREGAVGFSHAMRVFTLLHSRTAIVSRIKQLTRQAINHGGLVTAASSIDEPADGKCLAAFWTHINRNLIGCTTNAARTDFDVRSYVVERLMEQRDRLGLGLGFDCIERTVNDAFGNRLLAMKHDCIHELRDNEIAELRIRIDLTLLCLMASGHFVSSFNYIGLNSPSGGRYPRKILLRTLCTVLGTALLAVLDTLGIENATDDVVTHTRQVLHTTATDHHDGVLLQVMPFTRDITNDFKAVRQTNLGNLTQSRVRLLRGRRVNAGANAALLRVCLQCRNLIALHRRSARLADKLVYGRH